MPREEPLLTIAIPTFNCAHFLPDALASVMRQGLDDFEILIVDNASEDNTAEVVEALRNPHIRYLRNSSNIGPRENGNRCLANSRGRYVKFLCADDVLLDGVLQKQLRILERRPDVALVTCNFLETNANLEIQGVSFELPGSHSGHRVINFCLSRMANCVGGPSNIMFRSTAAAGIVSDDRYVLLADLKFALQILERGAYVNIDEPGYLYRRHSQSDFATNCPPEIHMPEFMRLVDEFNWWNPLNCTMALAYGGTEGRRLVGEHWLEALRPRRIIQAAEASAHVAYKRWYRFLNSPRSGQPMTKMQTAASAVNRRREK